MKLDKLVMRILCFFGIHIKELAYRSGAEDYCMFCHKEIK